MVDEDVLEVAVAVGFAGAVMLVVLAERRERLQPLVNVAPDARLVVVHHHAGCDVHRRHQHHALADAALAHGGFHLVGDPHVFAVLLRLEPEIFGVEFHSGAHHKPDSAPTEVDFCFPKPFTHCQCLR